MRKIYLIRHAQPDFPGGEGMCIGTTDIPIGTLGRLQSCVTARELKGRVSAVFSSCLSRAYDTALFISPRVTAVEGLREMYAGDWDGRTFSEIRSRWPELFRMRGDRYIPPPGAEDTAGALERFTGALGCCLENSEGDIAVVSHNSMIQVFLTHILPGEAPRYFYRMPYVSYTELEYDGAFHTDGATHCPRPPLDEELCGELMDASRLPERVKYHCQAVARKAWEICDEVNRHGCGLDRSLIYRAALLHDIARGEEGHPDVAAAWLSALGYPEEAELIRQHHDIEYTAVNEAAVLHIADKLCAGADAVTLEERFAASLEKCDTPEARQIHARRYETALTIKNSINNICDKELIP